VGGILYKYGAYGFEKGYAIFCECERQLARLQIYHLVNSLRAGDRPRECQPTPPAGRTLVEFATAAWTPFHGRFFRDKSVPGHHREPAWLAFAERLEQILTQQADAPLETIVEVVFDELVTAPLARYLEHERPDWEAPCPFGAFRYDAHDSYVALHFHNAYMPESPFAQPRRLVASLCDIIDDIDQRGLTIERIGVDSWIDYLPPFQALFPAEFAASLTPTDPDNKAGNGWWGQFIQRTGELNEPRAQRLRQTRRFDYVRTHGECSFAAFRGHVRRMRHG